VLGAADAADGVRIDNVHIQRTGGGAIVRADRTGGADGDGLVHGVRLAEGGPALNPIGVMGDIPNVNAKTCQNAACSAVFTGDGRPLGQKTVDMEGTKGRPSRAAFCEVWFRRYQSCRPGCRISPHWTG